MNKKTELSYNGWKNYETWLLSVWDYIPAFVDNYYDQELKPDDVNERDLEEIFYEYISSDIPRNTIIADVINAFLAEIDW